MKNFFVVNTSKSEHAALKPASLKGVELNGFIGDYIKRTVKVTLPAQYDLLESTGRIENFRRASGKVKSDFHGLFFNDTDVYKWIEAASYALFYFDDAELESKIDSLIREIADAQDEDGYLDTYFSLDRKPLRWTNMKDLHELYCAGHLMQAAVAHHRTTGKGSLLKIAVRFADHIADLFGPGKREGTSGHPEVEMGLAELYRETGDGKYLDLADFFLKERGKGLLRKDEYNIDHLPFAQMKELTGHAVRMLYLCAGAADLYIEKGDESIRKSLDFLWDDLVSKKMYLTGSAGSRHEKESFGEPYELPNRRAYTETCASIGNFMWNWRMLLATGDSKFADVMERALYNGTLSGISLDGKDYFYVNPLEDRGTHKRQPWYECACCPPNIARTLTSFPGYVYAVSDSGVWVNFYESGKTTLGFGKGDVEIVQKTGYPFDGRIDIAVSASFEEPFSIFVRKPGWSRGFELTVDGERRTAGLEKGYVKADGKWEGSHKISIEFPMATKFVASHPLVRENVGKAALQRGPLVYCVELADNPDFDVWDLFVDVNRPVSERFDEKLLNGVVALEGTGTAFEPKNWGGKLYPDLGEIPEEKGKDVIFKAVPYYAWANREEGPMAVWLNVERNRM